MKTKLHYVLTTAMLLFAFSVFAQTNFFVKASNNKSLHKNSTSKDQGDYYQFNYSAFAEVLTAVNKQAKSLKTSNLILEFPNEKGNLERFQIVESSVLHPNLQAKYPEIRSFSAQSLDHPEKHMRFSLSPYNGLSAVILGGKKTLVYQPVKNQPETIFVTQKEAILENATLNCERLEDYVTETLRASGIKNTNDALKRTYRIAISVTGEYAQVNGGTLASVNAAINATLTNVNAVFENDLNVSLELVSTNDKVVFLDPETDPYTTLPNYNNELAATLDTEILEQNYDIGHLLGGINDINDIGTGNAGCIACVCNDGGSYAEKNHKGSGFSTSATPSGINFDIDFVAHEIGHQFGATHTWTYDGFDNSTSQMEPGSGSTIMGYAGIARAYNVQLNSDPYFHAISIEQITNFVKTTTCAVITDTGNAVPSVSAGDDLFLPIGTPFKLVGSGSDANSNNVLTYCWEQFDEDNAGLTYPDPNSTNSNSVLFRSYLPTESSTRYFPNFSDLIYGFNATQWEKVPNVTRKADFRLTVRDNAIGGGHTNYDDMRITFDGNYGPFRVTSQNTDGIIWTSGTTETITWDVNNTNNLTGASRVNILLSTDGGSTYETILASNVSNNGVYTVIVPDISAPYCRVMIEPVGHFFFAINTHNFAVNYNVKTTCRQYASVNNLGLVITDNGKGFTESNTISIDDSSIITDINIGVNITHNYIGDLEFYVESPNGTEVLLKSHQDCGEQINMVGVYDDDAVPYNCLNSEADLPYRSLNELLSAFNSGNIQGDWTIHLGDFAPGDEGALNSWYVEVCETTLDVLDPENSNRNLNLMVFPNPSNGDFILKLYNPSGGNIDIQVFDTRSRLVYKETLVGLTNLEQVLNLQQLESGMYVLLVTTDGNTFTNKIIKK